MGHVRRFGGLLALTLASLAGVVTAQVPLTQRPGGASPASRIAGDWHSTAPVLIPASRPPLPHGAADLGDSSGGTRLDRMLLLLEPSATQQRALDAELANQLDSKSAEYHHWLTAATFADLYANSATDVRAVVAWLQS